MVAPPRRIWLDGYVLDTLMGDLVGHDRTPAAFVVYLFLWKESRRSRRRRVKVSHRVVADETGLSKSAVQAAVRLLKRRQLLRSYQATQTATPDYEVLRPWVRPVQRRDAR
jgi:replication initiation and membrane attachment protein DnaB